MDTHEYQAKEVLARYGVKVPRFRIVETIGQAVNCIDELGLDQAALKVQIHAGGRGKAGGVKLAHSKEEILTYVKDLLGMRIVTKQTSKEGVIAHKVMISELTDIDKEYYIGAVIDRKMAQAVLIASPCGGMDIEEVAEKNPEQIRHFQIDLSGNLRNYQLVQLAKFMGWESQAAKEGIQIVKGIAKAFIDSDATLLEVNPLVKTKSGEMVAVDAKLSIDDNALFRQKEASNFYDPTQVPENEAKANKYDLAYVALNGNIGCMVNGAGLAMATMDIIKYHGGTPANFLDVGGGADQEKVAEGFKIILSDPDVKAILINIFGGIMNCATLANGVVTAASELGVSVPLIVRMEGTNVENGKKILLESNLSITVAKDLKDAAEKAVELARK